MVVGDIGVVRSQHVGERLADVLAPSGRSEVDDGDWLAVERAASDRPVERVLERSRNAERVLRDGEQQSAGVRADLAEAPHSFGARTRGQD